jgi:hypothetical protein
MTDSFPILTPNGITLSVSLHDGFVRFHSDDGIVFFAEYSLPTIESVAASGRGLWVRGVDGGLSAENVLQVLDYLPIPY